MQKLALVLSVLAAGLAGYAAYVVSALPGEVRALRAKQESDDLEARVRTLERRASETAAPAPASRPWWPNSGGEP